ncbi:HYR domain-containing protein [Solitalea lacus]|uniref:HYR domain-containing protein n=1 Tax=Solitalea lacus TaxID=2911172 RepID=UPI001EDC4E2D|nr:HYR domain-containing protein [Solitalea lacus]UKJ06469.1 HYR domain-containing protein [Solitalea lacus]
MNKKILLMLMFLSSQSNLIKSLRLIKFKREFVLNGLNRFKKLSVLILLFNLCELTSVYAQCPYDNGALRIGVDQSLCVGGPATRLDNSSINSGNTQYAIVNVYPGFTYRIYTSNTKKPLVIDLFDEADKSKKGFTITNDPTKNPLSTSSDDVYIEYVANFTGRLRVQINQRGTCGNGLGTAFDVFIEIPSTAGTSFELNLTETHIDQTCNTLGSINVTASGGTPPYQYRLNGGALQSSGVFNSLSAGTYTVAVIDANNCSKSSQVITINSVPDNVPPTAICKNITIQLNAAGSATITAASIDNGSNDACGSVSLSASPTSFTCANLGANNVTLTVTDAKGNSSSCVAVVTVIDNIPPTAICKNITIPLNSAGSATITAADIDNGSNDVCGSVNLSASKTSFDCSNIGPNNVTLTVTDAKGNTSTCVAVVTVTDQSKPSITCPSDITIAANSACGATGVTLTPPVVSDNCTPVAGLTITNNAPATFPAGPTTVTWTVRDVAGNTQTCTQVVTVTDQTKPTITTCPADKTVAANSGCSATGVSLTPPVVSDNCTGTASLTITNDAPTTFPTGPTTVTWTVRDLAGNTQTCTQIITVADQSIPTITTCPSDITVAANSGCGATGVTLNPPVVSDNCTGTVSLTITNNAPTTFPAGSTTVTWTVKDLAGNTATCTQVVTVTDQTMPTITTCPSDITVAANSGCGATGVSLTPPVVVDNCSVAGGFTITNNAPATFPAGPTTVTWTVKDAAGNTTTCSQVVTVTDQTIPTITTCPANITVAANSGCGATGVSLTPPVVIDNCSVAGGFTITNNAPATFPAGPTTVTWTVKDAAGNTTTCAQIVTVTDQTKPVKPVLADVIGQCSATAMTPTTTDNCKGLVTGTTADAKTYSTQGIHVITWSFDDGNGNIETATQNVIVQDITKPDKPTLADVTGQCTATVTAPVVNDNCKGTVIGTTASPLTYSTQGTHVITWIFDDGNGNVETATQNVIIKDNIKPVKPVLGDVTGECSATATVPSTTDNCGGVILGTTTDALTYTTQGTHLITWSFDDGNGNVETATQRVIVKDVTKPVQPTLADVTGECSATASVPTTTDNCLSVVIGTTTDPLSYTTQGTHTITWTFNDGNGNVETATQRVIVKDITKPEIPVLADVTGECSATVSVPTTTDNCKGLVTGTTTSALTYTAQGTYTITWRFDDGNGNVETAIQKVIVKDITEPIKPVLADITGECSVTVPIPVAGENCGNVIQGTTSDPLTYTAQGTYQITWTFNDGNGNVQTATQNVIIKDKTLPVKPVLDDVTGECSATATVPTTTDICSGTIIGTTSDPLTYITQGTHVITWRFDDGHGNVETAAQNVIVKDITKPVKPILANVTGQCSATATAPVVNDNCRGTVTGTTANPLTYTTQGTHVITWTFDDGNGNVETATQNVIVKDITKPTIASCPPSITVPANNGCGATGVILTAPEVSDNCTAVADLIITNDAPVIFPEGNTVVTWTVTDAAGNTQKCNSQIVTVVDQTMPVIISCPEDMTVAANSGCGAVGVSLTGPVASDNCTATAGLRITNNAPATFPAGATTVTWTVKDQAGNIQTCTQVVTVTDQTQPTITTCPQDITVAANSGCDATGVTLTPPVVTDNCTGTGNFTITNNAPATFPAGTTTVTWTVKDAAGNIQTCTQVVTVTDQTQPTITTCPQDITVAANSGCDATGVTLTPPVVTDNCTGAGNFTITNNAPATFPAGTTTVTWTVKDAAGNIQTCTQVVTVTDQTQPTITTCPQDITVAANSGCDATGVTLTPPVVIDNCTGTGNFTITNNAPATFPAGATTVTWTVKDAAGNIQTCTQVVTVTDQTQPTITTCPQDITVAANSGCDATGVTLTPPVVTDNCTGAGNFTITNNAPATFPAGTTTVTWTVKDVAGNIQTCTQVVTVTDQTQPTITTCPQDITVAANSGCDATGVTLTPPVVTDNCTGTGNFTITNNAPATFPAGTTTVTWTVKDAAGNIQTCTQVVTVTDQTQPTITTCPQDITVAANSGCDATGVTLTPPVVIDNCTGTGNFTITNNAPATFPAGSTTVTWTVKDAAGNIQTCTQVVTVTDQTQPTITSCPQDITVAANSGCVATGVTLTPPVVIDNCTGTGNFTITNNAPATFPAGTTTVTWTVKDAAGNIQTCTQVVTVTDQTQPTITTCPQDITVAANSGCDATGVTLTPPVVIDNCTGTGNFTITNNAPATFPAGTTTVTWTVKDAAGNIQTCTQVVTVTDQTQPTITSCPQDITVAANSGCDATGVTLTPPVVTDNCTGTGNFTITNNAPATFPAGTTTVTWTVKDAAGNIQTCTQLVTVTDQTQPTITTCPQDITVAANSGCDATGVTLTPPVVTDNCTGTGNFTITNNAPATFPAGTTTVTWTVKDAAGNIQTCTQIVTVTDQTQPTITTCPQDITVAANSGCDATGVTLTPPVVTDNCTGAGNFTITYNAPATFPAGTTTVIWTVKDAAGNIQTCTQVVTVTDQTQPTITTCPQDITVAANSGCDATGVTLTPPVVTDNCTGTGNFTITNNAPVTFPAGTTTVTWTVKDAAGNMQTCTQLVTVTDQTQPTITSCPQDITVAANSGCDATGVTLTPPVVTDNCTGTGNFTITNNAPATFPAGTTTVIWTVKDVAGNIQTCTQIVTVTDQTKPVKPVVLADVIGECSATVSVPSTTDNCSGTIMGTTTNPLTYTVQGSYVITWSFDDGHGNVETAIQNVIVKDVTAPQITAPADIVSQGLNTGSSINLGTPVTSDNCGVASVTNDAPAFFTEGVTKVTWTVTDVNGLKSTAVQNVTIGNVGPIAPDVDLSTLMNHPVSADALEGATNPDNVPSRGKAAGLTLSNVSQPSHGTVSVGSDNIIKYTPANGYYGKDVFYYTVCDNGKPALCATGKITVDVLDDNVDLVIKKTTLPNSVNLNEEFEYSIEVSNSGHVNAHDVVVLDPLSDALVYVSSSANSGQAVYDPNTHKITWNLVSLNVNESAILTLKVKGVKGGNVLNRAEVVGPQPELDPSSNIAEVIKTVLGFKIPNVFTPNGDAFNETFVIEGIEDLKTELVVMSRWGNEVYKSQNYKNDWDGSQLHDGTYFYVLTVTASDNRSVKYTGYVTILR